MADNASITILRNTKANIDAEPIKDGNILFTTDQAENKIYTDVGTRRIQIGGTVDVDTELSTTSTNPVQNKVITNSINSINDAAGKLQTEVDSVNDSKQDKTDNALTTTAKSIVGAINEVNDKAGDNADSISNVSNGLTQEVSRATSSDANLQAQIDQLVAPSGTAPNPAEVQNARIGADGVTYDTLGNAIRGQVTDLKSALGEETRNLFDHYKMRATGITINDDGVTGAASAFNTAFNQGIPLGVAFESNAQYTWSFKAKNNGDVTTGNGLSVRFKYTDNTVDANVIPNSTTTDTQFSFTSASGKTISALVINYSSAGGNVWELKNIQLEVGTVASEYIPHISATDYIARESLDESNININSNTAKLQSLTDDMYTKKTVDVWENGMINSSTGVNKESDTFARTRDYISKDIMKISLSDDYLFAVYAYDENGYVGYLDTNNNFTTSGILQWFNCIAIKDLSASYFYRIVVKLTNAGVINVDAVKYNAYFYVYRFVSNVVADTVIGTDLLSIRKQIPPYYFALPDEITSYNDTEYLNQKINSIPNGKHFIFITDPHWKNNNAKNSTILLKYVKQKMRIKHIFQGGDIINQEDSKYAAKAQMSLYMNEMIDAFGEDFLCVQGNHDKNVANLSHVLELHPELTESDVAMPYDVIYETEMAHFADKVNFADWTNWLAQTGATGSDLAELDAYRKMHYYMDDDDQKIRYIVVCATNTEYNGTVRTYFGAVSLNEANLQYEWFRDTLRSTPNGYDIVVLSHVIVNDHKNGTGTWMPYDQIAYYLRMMGGMATRTNVTVRNMVSTDSTEGALLDTFFSSGAHTMQFSDVGTSHNVMFMLGGDCHCDVLCKTDLNMNVEFVDNGGTVQLSNGEIPAITTLCDARAVPSINQEGEREVMTAGTVSEQCFEVVTITSDKRLVFTRFGAGTDRSIQLT